MPQNDYAHKTKARVRSELGLYFLGPTPWPPSYEEGGMAMGLARDLRERFLGFMARSIRSKPSEQPRKQTFKKPCAPPFLAGKGAGGIGRFFMARSIRPKPSEQPRIQPSKSHVLPLSSQAQA